MADGNLHIVLNRTGPLTHEISSAVEQILYPSLQSLGGSFSAEHGVGSKRIFSLISTVNPTKLNLMALIKTTVDPRQLINPGKVLPLDALAKEKSE